MVQTFSFTFHGAATDQLRSFASHRTTIVQNGNSIWGSAEEKNEKPSVPKCSEGLRKSSGKLEKLFSSFLRGASCPKSPRVAATAAIVFMPEPVADVKSGLRNGNRATGLDPADRDARRGGRPYDGPVVFSGMHLSLALSFW